MIAIHKLLLILSLAAAALSGCASSDDDVSTGVAAVSGISEYQHKCRPLTNVRNLLTDDEIRSMPQAESFSPPVLSGEDIIVNHLKGDLVLGPSDYSVTTNFGDCVDGAGCGHLGLDYDETHGYINDSHQAREDARYPIRAVADGVVVYAGYICAGDTVLKAPTRALNAETHWGIMIRILHRAKTPAGADQYYLSVYAHLEGSTDPLRGNEKLTVHEGDRIKRRQIIATIGPTQALSGGIPWATHLHHEVRKVQPFSDLDVEKTVLNNANTGYSGTTGWQGRYINPQTLYADYGYKPTKGPVPANYPVGTIVYRTRWTTDRGRDYYQVCAAGTLCHIENEQAFYANRFYLDGKDPWIYAAEIGSTALSCSYQGTPITNGPTMSVVTCGDGTYLSFSGNGQNVRRRINADPSTAHYRIMLRSWGFGLKSEVAGGAACGLPEGKALVLRDGTVIEQSSDNDFYVITNGGLAQRLRRDVFVKTGYPYGAVIMVPDGSVPALTNGMDSSDREFTLDDVQVCAHPSQGGGDVTSPTATDPITPATGPCVHHTRRCGDKSGYYDVCLMNYEGTVELGTEWGSFACPEGQICVAEGQCAVKPNAIVTTVDPTWASDDDRVMRLDIDGSTVCLLIRPQRLSFYGPTPSSVCLAGNLPGIDWNGQAMERIDDETLRKCWTTAQLTDGKPFAGCGGARLPYRFGLVGCSGSSWAKPTAEWGNLLWSGQDDQCNATTGGAIELGSASPTQVAPATADAPHTIRCTAQLDGSMVIDVTGPLLDGSALMALPESPSSLALGADNLGWPSQISAPWRGDDTTHRLTVPSGVTSFNLKLNDATNAARDSWLRLAPNAGSPWQLAGDCVAGTYLIARK